MSSPSNVYAEKVYAEHPIALWAFDDTCDFVSYLSSSDLNIYTWTKSGMTTYEDFDNTQNPFPPIQNGKTLHANGGNTLSTVTLTGPTFSSTTGQFSLGFYFNSQTANVSSVSVQYGTETPHVQDMSGIYDEWIYISKTFVEVVADQPIVIKINYATIDSNSEFYINGLSIGYGQQNFGTVSTGVQLSEIPATINYTGYGLVSPAYGSPEDQAYYIGDQESKTVFAKNSSVPLVFGANSVSILSPNTTPGSPSIIVPGFGFMNDNGRFQNLTLEAWIRPNVDGSLTGSPRKILGPIAHDSGLYVDGPYLTLKVGDYHDSHYVGEWFRPMLIHIEMTKDLASLIVNGERVITLRIDSANVSLPLKIVNDKDQDYIGFYAHEDIPTLEVDCIAIYPYRVPPVVAKRRFAYGQAVVAPENIATAYAGTQMFVDYTYAGYSFDMSYPKIESWGSSVRDNVYNDNSVMGTPRHEVPMVILSKTFGKSISDMSEWKADIKQMNELDSDANPYFRIRPNYSGESRWSEVSGYAIMKKILVPGMGTTESIYGVFQKSDDYQDEQVLLRLKNKSNNNQMSITIDTDLNDQTYIHYRYNISGKKGSFATKTLLASGEVTFAVGINIAKFIEYARSNDLKRTGIPEFLAGLSSLELYIGGDYAGDDLEVSNTFAGKIYGVALCSDVNAKEISPLFGTNGLAITTNHSQLLAHDASYMFGSKKFSFGDDSTYNLDISSKSYWQDYIPLKKMSKVASDQDGNETYKTDMIQFSIDYPSSSLTDVNEKIDTSNEVVKTYVTFHYSWSPISLFGSSLTLEKLPASGIVDAKTNWAGKKFEVVDGSVIIPPSTFATGSSIEDVLMTTIIEMKSDAISVNRIGIRMLQYSAQTYNTNSSSTFDINLAKGIGTRLGKKIYPFAESDGNFVYGTENPMSIGKLEAPYLYLTNKSGIKVLGAYGDSVDRGLYLPVNETGASSYLISAMSMFVNYNDKSFSGDQMSFLETYDSQYGKIRFVLNRISATENKTAIVKAQKKVGASWEDLSGIEFYINGIYTPDPVINVNEWAMLGMLFIDNPLDFSSMTEGRIEVVGSILLSHISYYQINADLLSQQVTQNEWNDVLSVSYAAPAPSTYLDNTWGAVLDNTAIRGVWSAVAFSKTTIRPSFTPENIFKIYTGTNKIVSSSDSSGIKLKNYEYSIYKDAEWSASSLLSV